MRCKGCGIEIMDFKEQYKDSCFCCCNECTLASLSEEESTEVKEERE